MYISPTSLAAFLVGSGVAPILSKTTAVGTAGKGVAEADDYELSEAVD